MAVTVIDQAVFDMSYFKAFYGGLSTDTKPTNCAATSTFLETDTGDMYIFDGASWLPMTRRTQQGLAERMMANVLKRLNVDANGRLRVAAETVANMSTLTTVTTVATLTNIGLLPAVAREQAESNARFQQGFRRNLVVT